MFLLKYADIIYTSMYVYIYAYTHTYNQLGVSNVFGAWQRRHCTYELTCRCVYPGSWWLLAEEMSFSHWGRHYYVAHVPVNNLPPTQGQETLIKSNGSHIKIRREASAEKKGLHQEWGWEMGVRDKNPLREIVKQWSYFTGLTLRLFISAPNPRIL